MKENGNTDAHDDDRCVALSKKGDVGAFETLVRRHQKMMLNIAYRMVGNYEEACEIVQDAFVSAYRKIKDFEERSAFSTWLSAIVINLSRNRIKQMKANLAHESFSLDDPIATEDGFIKMEQVSGAPSVLDRLEEKQMQEKVQDCIRKLDHDFRAVLVLRDIQGFSYDEIGGILKLTGGTVKSRLFRARESVKDCLKKAFGRL
jgi:RNA polymerase sigma-70 factor (ECF subfamily)